MSEAAAEAVGTATAPEMEDNYVGIVPAKSSIPWTTKTRPEKF